MQVGSKWQHMGIFMHRQWTDGDPTSDWSERQTIQTPPGQAKTPLKNEPIEKEWCCGEVDFIFLGFVQFL